MITGKDVVRAFLEHPAAAQHVAPVVRVHQLGAGRRVSFERTPHWFAATARAATVHELMAEPDRVYARWSVDDEVRTLVSGV